jgi:IclR-like helix-turn-helix domain-containing protein
LLPQLPPRYHQAPLRLPGYLHDGYMSQRDQIEIILRLWIDLTRQIHQAADPARQSRFGAGTGPLLISAAVLAATLDRRPMTAHKLAGYVGMARPTVIRHLHQLEQHGAV